MYIFLNHCVSIFHVETLRTIPQQKIGVISIYLYSQSSQRNLSLAPPPPTSWMA